MYKTELDWVSAYKKLEAELESKDKRIAELEKENAELKTIKIPQLERKIASIRGSHRVDANKLKARIEQVERLKKENAELKEQNIKDCENFNKTMKETKEQWNREHYQLTNAKEIIKTFLAIVNNEVEYVQNPKDCKDLWKELCEKAEQFIKNSEVEK